MPLMAARKAVEAMRLGVSLLYDGLPRWQVR
jgi:hypothetical protein